MNAWPLVISLAVAALALAGCGSTPHGFQRPGVLQADLTRQINMRLGEMGGRVRVRSILCVEESRQSARCLVRFSDGTSEGLAVAISADGDRYVTH